MTYLRGLTQLIELEILTHETPLRENYDLEQIKSTAVEILQASKCHQGCVCNHKCGCAKTNKCYRCKPPKRILRIGKYPGAGYGVPGFIEGSTCTATEESIQVSSNGIIVSRKSQF